MTVFDAKRDTCVVIDFNARAGRNATPDQWENAIVDEIWTGYGWVLDGRSNDIGYGAIGTPGTLAGLASLHRDFASMAWADLLQPAIDLAQHGFLVSPELAQMSNSPDVGDSAGIRTRLFYNEESRRLYLNEQGEPYGAGQTFRNPDYAATLERIATLGAQEFYTGALAREIADDLARNGSTITLEDLESYEPVKLEPVEGSYRGHDIRTNHAPGGGPSIIEMLNILEDDDLPGMGHNSEDYVYTVARAQIAAMIDRAECVGDPRFVDVPTERLISKCHAADWRTRLATGETIVAPRYQPDGKTTTHLSVIDKHRNSIALTHTLGASSGVVTPGLGFMYNNAMNCFDPRPGLVNSIEPGKGRITGIAPTITFQNDTPAIILGAPGGTRIMTGIFHVLVNSIAFGMSAVEAVSAPRFDCQSDILDGEARIPSWVMQGAADRAGLKRWVNPAPWGNFAYVQAIHVDQTTGRVTGGADPRGGGAAMSG
jgi:gamma-glutamyltranspeptidase/glutathione hydrolase